MLAWALWLAWSLIRWVPWAWQSFGAGGLWRSVAPPSRPPGGDGGGEPRSRGGSSAAGSRGSLATTQQGVQAHTSSASEAIFSTRGDSVGGVDSPLPQRRSGASDTLPGANPRMADTEIQKPARLADTEIQKPAARLADTEIQKPKASARVVAQGALPQPDAHTKPRQPPPPHAGGLPTRRGTKGAEPEEMMPDDDEGL
jgi:hypothetical protein